MNLPTMPKTSLIVLNTLCPCRDPREDAECCGKCRTDGVSGRCCPCHMLVDGVQRTGEYLEVPDLACAWFVHEVANGHAAWEQDAIRLMREYRAAVSPLSHWVDPHYSEEERDRISAARVAIDEFLGED